MTSQTEIDNLAVLWNKTKDLKYKKLWYKKVKEFAYGGTSTRVLYDSSNARRYVRKRIL